VFVSQGNIKSMVIYSTIARVSNLNESTAVVTSRIASVFFIGKIVMLSFTKRLLLDLQQKAVNYPMSAATT